MLTIARGAVRNYQWNIYPTGGVGRYGVGPGIFTWVAEVRADGVDVGQFLGGGDDPRSFSRAVGTWLIRRQS